MIIGGWGRWSRIHDHIGLW